MKVYVQTTKIIEIEIESKAIETLANPSVSIDYKKEIETAIEEINEKLGIEILPDGDEMIEINKDYMFACYADKKGYSPIFEI